MKFLRVALLLTFMVLVANVAASVNPYRGMKLCLNDSACPSDRPYCRSTEGSKAQMSYCAIEPQISRWRKCDPHDNVPDAEWKSSKPILPPLLDHQAVLIRKYRKLDVLKLCKNDSDCPTDEPFCRLLEGNKIELFYCAMWPQMKEVKCVPHWGNVPDSQWELPIPIRHRPSTSSPPTVTALQVTALITTLVETANST